MFIATVPGRGGRPYLDEYLERGWISEKDTVNVPTGDEYKGSVTKTVEYAYDDYYGLQYGGRLRGQPYYHRQ